MGNKTGTEPKKLDSAVIIAIIALTSAILGAFITSIFGNGLLVSQIFATETPTMIPTSTIPASYLELTAIANETKSAEQRVTAIAQITQMEAATATQQYLSVLQTVQADLELTRISPVEIAVLNINTVTLSDGTIQNTAQLSVKPLGLGTLQLTSPSTIKMGESSIIRLSITPDSVLADLPRVTAPAVSANAPDYALEFSDRLQIYPVMIAELRGVNFDIESDNHQEKPVTSIMPVEWIWNVTPLSGGKQTLFLAISIPVIIDQSRNVVSAQTLKNIPIEIQVEVTSTPNPSETPKPTQTPIPTFTTTPLPPIERIGEKIIENVSALIVAVIGLIGVLAGAYVAYLNVKKTKVVKSTTNKAKKK